MTDQRKDLKTLLQKQIQNYNKAIVLEEKLKRNINTSKFEKVPENTQKKKILMDEVQQLDVHIGPLLDEIRSDEESLSDPKIKELVKQALELLEKIQVLEKSNLQDIVKNRQEMVNLLKKAQTAKKVAKGYKPTKSIYRSKLDTKT